MIKAKMGNTVLLGLSDQNIEHLKMDEPILITKDELGIDYAIAIIWGPTEMDIYRKLKHLTNDKTIITGVPDELDD